MANQTTLTTFPTNRVRSAGQAPDVASYTQLEQLTAVSACDLLQLHGMGSIKRSNH